MMKCGHAASGTNMKTGTPSCVICVGITPDAEIVVDEPDLTGRFMKCDYRTTRDGRVHPDPIPSNPRAAFFGHDPLKEFDSYYCGCWGWD